MVRVFIDVNGDAATAEEARARVEAALGPGGWTQDPDVIAPHLTEWRNRWTGDTPILLTPRSTDEVARAVTINRPRAELYAFWRDFSNLPPILDNVVRIEVLDRVGVLKDILTRLSDHRINVSDARVRTNPGKPARIDLKQLQRLRRDFWSNVAPGTLLSKVTHPL